MGKKEKLAHILFSVSSPFRPLLTRIPTARLVVLAYHRINELPDPDYPYQEETISATPEMFRSQLAFLRRRCFVTTFAELDELLKAGEKLPRNTVIVTFDDGYRDNFDIALPILQEFQLPAVVYIVTNNIDTTEPFWFDTLSYALINAPNGRLKLNWSNTELEFRNNNRKELRRQVGDLVRLMTDTKRRSCLREILQYSDCENRLKSEDRLVMNWQEVRELSSAGIEIGSHTCSHPFLSRLNESEIDYELGSSKSKIECEIDRDVVSLSYPTGSKTFYDTRVIRTAKSLGYQFAVSYDHDAVSLAEMNRFEIPRVHVEPDVTQPLFEANATIPSLFLRSLPLR